MLVSHTHRFIYLKTAKTAGTSVEVFFERFCRPDPENIEHIVGEIVSAEGIVGFRGGDKELQAQATYHNHMPASAVRQALGDDVWSSYFKFCAVRDPYDQVVSLFWMDLTNDQRKVLKPAGAPELRSAFRDWMQNRQLANRSRRICFIDGAPAVDDVIRYEALDDGVARICARIGGEPGPLGAYKTKIRRNRAPFQAYYDEQTAAKVQESYDLEFDCFGYDRESWRG